MCVFVPHRLLSPFLYSIPSTPQTLSFLPPSPLQLLIYNLFILTSLIHLIPTKSTSFLNSHSMSALRFPNLPPSEPQGANLLAQERANTTFSVHEVSTFLYGEAYLERQERLLSVIENEPAFDKSNRYFRGRTERFAAALRKDHALVKLSKELQWSPDEYLHAESLIDEAGPFGLHRGMFMPTLASQSTKEQLEKFLKPAQQYEIIGCYAQTELGHGSNVQGIETTATYIPETNQFELHTPYLTASKWWIGGLGKAANHAVVMARLITNGKDYGPHALCVPIRSMEDHTLLPGVMAGDIGPKFG